MRRPFAAFPWVVLAACAGSPLPSPNATPAPTPPATPPSEAPAKPTTQEAPATPAPSLTRAGTARVARLDNGLQAVLTTLPPGRDALVQLGLQAGTATQAPGLADLTMHALLASTDPSQGRPALQQAIAALGGTSRVHAGSLTTWLELRVPGPRWQDALQALREALAAPPQSRHHFERVRDERVRAFAATVQNDPLATMAAELLVGSAGTAIHVNDLVDRDPGEIGAFLTRHLRPDRCVLAIEAPATSEAQLAHLKTGEGFASWKTSSAPGSTTTLERPFPAGVHWRLDATDTPCSIAIVAALPDLLRPEAALAFVLHACVTLDGTGGRFERLQKEQGLALAWHSEIVQSPDSVALVLRATGTPAEAALAWRIWNAARRSLQDVAPTAEELALARRRAPLSARLSLLEAGARGRTVARLASADRTLAQFDAAMAVEPAGAPLASALAYLRDLPSALVVSGGEPPAELADVQRFRPLPNALTTAVPSATPDAKTTAADAAPWLAKAIDAIGGSDRLLRLHGWTAEARLGNDRAPAVVETLTWRDDGSYERVREVLGQRVTTTLQGNEWKEMLGTKGTTLTAREAKLLRDQQFRHPLALLAAHLRGELPFRVVSQRAVGDRDLLVLEATGNRDERLRVHLDAESCLLRAVETWETLPDGSPVHVHDAWSDYRSVGGLRVPHHRLTTQDDGQNRIETAFTRWTPTLR